MPERKEHYKRGLQITITILTVFAFLYSGFCFLVEWHYNTDTDISTECISSSITSNTSLNANDRVLPCGFPVGIYLKTDGLLVVDTDNIIDMSGKTVNPTHHLIQSGDYIENINGTRVDTKEKLTEFLQRNGEQELQIVIRRNGQQLITKVQPTLAQDHTYKIGLWIRDDSHGIGTMTFMDKNGNFAALGHGISDVDTGELLNSEEGELYQTQIYAITKGKVGLPGSLVGMIDYSPDYFLGNISRNSQNGIFGNTQNMLKKYVSETLFHKSFDDIWEEYALSVAKKEEVHSGDAQIISYVNGNIERYMIEIRKIDLQNTNGKNMVIRVKDKSLLEQTGGIIRGMSGSPIVQDGKIVGAVTHVFVNNPKEGYAIFAETMLNSEHLYVG
jgi:stage IV sporulation protein B